MDIFINLPTRDLERAKTFYTALGWRINPLFSDENGAAIVIEDGKYLMVLKREFYATFIGEKEVGDPATTSLALVSFDLPSKSAVDEFAQRVHSAGGTLFDPVDYGFMYQRAFDDPDGNHFEPFWMDPKAAEEGPEAMAESQVPQ